MFSRKFDRMNLIVLSSVILFWKNRGNETKKELYEEEGKEVDDREDVSITYSVFINQIGSHFWWWLLSLLCLFIFSMCKLCFYQRMIVDYTKNSKNFNSRLLSSIQSNHVNVRCLHVQSALRVLNERMAIDFQEEQKQSKLQCNVSCMCISVVLIFEI